MSTELMIQKIQQTKCPVVAGLDPKIEYIPQYIRDKNYARYGKNENGIAGAILEFNKGLIDELSDVVPAIKPQAAYYEMYGLEGIAVLYKTIEYAKQKGMYVILDAKRGDIGTTAQAYSSAWLGMTNLDGEKKAMASADCLTVNPYLGSDGILPFVSDCKTYNKGIFALVKTSNPSSGEMQDLLTDGVPIYEKVARLVVEWGKDSIGEYGYSAVGAVVGATYPEQAQKLRQIMPNVYFLVPGYGAQGATAKDVAVSFNKDGLGAIVNSSRAIMCAYQTSGCDERDYAKAAKDEAYNMGKAINAAVLGR